MTRGQLVVKMIEIYEDHPGTAIERMLKALRLAESEIPPPPSQDETIRALVEALEMIAYREPWRGRKDYDYDDAGLADYWSDMAKEFQAAALAALALVRKGV